MTHSELVLFGRVGLAFALCFAIGFERELRGSPAGDRTYAMVGLAAAAISAVTYKFSPQAIAGVITGIGFIGAALVFREDRENIKGITSAATIVAVVGIGIVSGVGHPWLAVATTAVVLIDLELRNIPIIKRFDARRYSGRAKDDMAPPSPMRGHPGP